MSHVMTRRAKEKLFGTPEATDADTRRAKEPNHTWRLNAFGRALVAPGFEGVLS